MENSGNSGTVTAPPPQDTPPTQPSSKSLDDRRHGSSKKEKKIGHRRVTGEGTVTYKKKTTSELQRAIQLGIHVSVSLTQQKPKRDVLLRDFGVIETVSFPREGSKTTPAHNLSDFRFKTYAPTAFRFFRDLFRVDMRDFLDSLCNQELRELSNPGASGSIFYISHDDEFIIKTVQHKEATFLQELLPEYFMNLTQHPRTLLPKFYGLYCYQCAQKNIRFVVMNNLIPSSIKLHEKYDLKGSTFKRLASARERSKGCPTLKDLDFREIHSEGLLLEAETYEALKKTIERDCRVLESFRIMDYSMLLAVHNLDKAKREREDETKRKQVGPEASASGNGATDKSPDTKAANAHSTTQAEGVESGDAVETTSTGGTSQFTRGSSRGRSVRRIAAYSTAMEAIQASVEPVELETDEVNCIPQGGIPSRNGKGDRLLLFVGVIDILQSYQLFKKMEHTFKSIVHDADTISVHNPSFYAQRFQNFFYEEVFKKVVSPMKQAPSKKKLKARVSTRESECAGERDDGGDTEKHSAVDDKTEDAEGSPNDEKGE